ncbi:MAG: VWA domain-containing protein [Blastocatellia bacterium]|nr:VWA domain-containing protein [Blastocatellia bacterium]
MRIPRSLVHSLIALLALFVCFTVAAQTQKEQKPKPPRPGEQQAPGKAEDSITIDVDLVNVPLVASDRGDVYVYDLRKEELTVFEDGVRQEIVFFGTVREPFHVVLMLDTSGSTREKLGRIQDAAKAFVNQLQPADRVKIISFDDNVRDWGEFAGDRAQLRSTIDFLSPGQGTKLYDAVKLGLNSLQRIKGRKAIVLFTDGVDYHSDSTTYEDNVRQVEESGVLIYPIRYDTRIDTEALVRDQQTQGESSDLGTIFGGGGGGRRSPGGPTPPTMPGGGRSPMPGGGRVPDIGNLPIPPIIIGGGGGRYPDGSSRNPNDPRNRYPDDRYPDNRYPGGNRYPDDRFPDDRYPDDRRNPRNPGNPGDPRTPGTPSDRYPDSRIPDSRSRRDDNIKVMLDGLYGLADSYLQEMAFKSGGKLHRADTLRSLPDAFGAIAAELRNQYSLGYYPSNDKRDGAYRKIQVKLARPNVVVRARPGYRSPGPPPKSRPGK